MASNPAFAATPPTPIPQPLLDGRITFEAAPDWVELYDYAADFPRQREDAITCLLHHEQIHAETGCISVRTVLRLESMRAVQNFSQWHLDLDPRTRSLALHTLKVVRDGVIEDHASPEKLRLVQSNEGAEAFVLNDRHTLLTLFEDVRPGDRLEVSYTLRQQTRGFPRNCYRWLTLPENFAITRFAWSVLHAPARNLRHLAAPALGAPETGPAGALAPGLLRWSWQGEVLELPVTEPQTPPWKLPARWLQISDLGGWNEIGTALAADWLVPVEHETLATEARRIQEAAATLDQQIEIALRLIQDEFRHLNVKLELDNEPPTPPAEVLRRRYGNGKDRALLLCRLLDLLGVPARPILVHSNLGPRLPELLPSPDVLNHVVVELTLGDATRWIDPALRLQGGGALGRPVPAYAFGIPVDSSASGPIPQPEPGPDAEGRREIHETLLLDTRGRSSLLRVRQLFSGRHADELRNLIEVENTHDHQRTDGKYFATRYGAAELETPVANYDNRDLNIVRTVETYRIHGFVDLKRSGGQCAVALPASPSLLALPRPEPGPRLAPWWMPHPVRMEHTLEVLGNALIAQPSLARAISDAAVTLFLKRKFARGRWVQTLSVETRIATLPADQIDEHAQTLSIAWRECPWSFIVRAGVPRPHRRHEFNAPLPLPVPENPRPASTPSPPIHDTPTHDTMTASSAAKKADRAAKRLAGRSNKRRKKISPWIWLVVGVLAVGASTLCLLYFKS
jgi:transglutaminase-like putative cysteine protease